MAHWSCKLLKAAKVAWFFYNKMANADVTKGSNQNSEIISSFAIVRQNEKRRPDDIH